MASQDQITSPGSSPFVRDGIDLRLLARRQRMSIWLFLGCVISIVHMCGPNPSGSSALVVGLVLLVLLRLVVVIGTLRLMSAMQSTPLVLVIMAALMLFPFINLIALAIEDRRAVGLLRRAGIPVGLTGVREDDVVRLLEANVCRKCGYDLTGNESGLCSECGMAIPVARGIAG